MVRRMFAIALAAALMAGTAYAQQAPAAPAKQEKPAPKTAGAGGAARTTSSIELTITDQAGPGAAEKRTVSMIVADRKNGSIRSSGRVMRRRARRLPSR